MVSFLDINIVSTKYLRSTYYLVIIILIVILFSSVSFSAPKKIYLKVPFLCQAPYGNWSQPWQEACEEAAILMVMGDPSPQEILKMVKYQKQKYAGHYDLTAKQMAQLLKDYYGVESKVKYDITIQDIKDQLDKGNPVIVPCAGMVLENPYYTPPGPAYHALVIIGYNDKTREFVTNDPGTKRGKSYRYKYDILYEAIADWTGDKKTILRGRKVMLIISKQNAQKLN